jgi:hypothetical protein
MRLFISSGNSYKAAMYIRIPEPLKEQILKEIKQSRVKSSLKHFPAAVLIFSAGVFLILAIYGHDIIDNIRDDMPAGITKTVAYVIIFFGIALLITPAMIFVLIKLCRDCQIQKCFYCPKCDAVDSFDSGTCAYCNSPLTESAEFIFTTFKDELKLLKRHGLEPSRDS